MSSDEQDTTTPASDAENAFWQAFDYDHDRNRFYLREGLEPVGALVLAIAKHQSDLAAVMAVVGRQSSVPQGTTIEDIARVCHEANRAWQHVTGDPVPSPAWDEAPEWQRASAIEGVQKALDGHTPEQLHDSWAKTKTDAGWQYGPVKDGDVKTHPCLVPYAELPASERTKDVLFRAIVSALTA